MSKQNSLDKYFVKKKEIEEKNINYWEKVNSHRLAV
jgi:hypothetical protein